MKMSVQRKLSALVGAGLFFEHVSARAAFMLEAHHDRGMVKGSGARSTQPGTHVGFYGEYFANERAINWNGYTDTALLPSSGDRILLDVLPSLTMLGPINILRTGTDAHALIDSEAEAATANAINADLLPVGAAAAFPAFDLFASALHEPEIDVNRSGSWPGIQLADSGDLDPGLTTVYSSAAAIMPRTGGDEAWAIWMKPAANIPANSGMTIWADALTSGK